MTEKDEELTGILQAANKHPNSRVSKLIRCVEEERSQKNIVLLLIELAEHAEYASEFGISLKYYLDLFERLGHGRDIVLNEAGLLLVNSSKIYSRRVDYVHELVERQLLTLSSTDREIAEGKTAQQANCSDSADAAPKAKRGRKRLLAAPTDPYEVELVPKKFRKLSEEKRFAFNRPSTKMKPLRQHSVETEQYLHPAVWLHASIVDLENEEEIDSKRNYKLFTYHVEHRYNTLVPDINFRLHFKVKDYMDEEEERLLDECEESADSGRDDVNRDSGNGSWPPLSEEYVQKYLNLENRIFEQELLPKRKRMRIEHDAAENVHEETFAHSNSALNMMRQSETADVGTAEGAPPENARAEPAAAAALHALEKVQNANSAEEALITEQATAEHSEVTQNDSALGQSFLDATNANTNSTQINESTNETIGESDISTNVSSEEQKDVQSNTCTDVQNNDSALEPSLLDASEDSVGTHETTAETSMLEQSADEALTQNDSALGESVTESNNTQNTSNVNSTANETQELNTSVHDVEESVAIFLGKVFDDVEKALVESIQQTLSQSQLNLKNDDSAINLKEIRVHLPHLDDEGVYFSDLDEQECRMLSPTVVATDVFPSVPNKQNLTIIVDDEIKAMLNLLDEEQEQYELPAEKPPIVQPILLNIFKIHEKILRRRLLFKLGPDMDVYIQARSLKRARTIDAPRECRQPKMLKWFPLNSTDLAGVYASPAPTPGHDTESEFNGFTDSEDEGNDRASEFLGFSEEELKGHRLSRDSGVCVDSSIAASKLDTIAEEGESDGAINTTETLELVADASNKQEHTRDVPGVECNVESDCLAKKEPQEGIDATEKLEESDTATDTTTQLESETLEAATETTENKDNVDNDEGLEDDVFETGAQLFLNPESLNSFEKEFNETLAEIELHGSRTKIQKWHEHLQPILAKSRERHHFDVFQLGSEIINEIQTAVAEQQRENEAESIVTHKTFQDVMKDKDASYVSRYFLSTLLLANQGNIDINLCNKSSEEPTHWSDIQLKLLSTKRHTIAIEDNIGMINESKKQTKIAATSKKQTTKSSSVTVVNCSRSTSNNAALNVNLNVVKPLKEVEKLPRVSDDFDSGIFSSEELAL